MHVSRPALAMALGALAVAVLVLWQSFHGGAPTLGPALPAGPAVQLLGGSDGAGPGELVSVAAWQGAIAVADRKAQQILRVNPSGGIQGRWGPDLGVLLKEPAGIAARPGTDELYVLDRGGGPAVLRLGPDGRLRGLVDLTALGTYGPNGLLALPDGRLAVADTGRSRVLILDEGGRIVKEIGPGQAPLKQPFAVAPLPGGALAITEHERNALVVVEPDGSARASHDLPNRPQGVASDPDGRVYVPDADQTLIRELDGSAREIASFPAPVTGASEVTLIGSDLYVLSPGALARQPLSGIGGGAPASAGPPANWWYSWATDDPLRLAFFVLLAVVLVLVRRRQRRAAQGVAAPASAAASTGVTRAVATAAPAPRAAAIRPVEALVPEKRDREVPPLPRDAASAPPLPRDVASAPPPAPRPLPRPERPERRWPRLSLGRSSLAVVFIALIGLAWVQSQVAAQAPRVPTSEAHPGTTLVAGLAGLLIVEVILAALVGAALPRVHPQAGRAGATELATLGGIVAVAAILRLIGLGDLPQGLWFDTAENGNVALRILHDPTYRPVFVGGATQLPAFFMYLVAGAIAALGANPMAVRLPSALLGLATVPAIWWLGRRIAGPALGLAAAFILATSHWHLAFSRLGLSSAAVPLALCLALALTHVALSACTPRSRTIAAGGAGLVAALGIWAYPAAAFVPVALAGLIAWWTVRSPLARWRQAARVCAVAGIVGGLALLPLAVDAVKEPETVFQRPETVVAGNDATALAESTWQHLLMFTVRGDRNGRHNLPGAPMLGGFAALFLAGVAYASARPRRAVFLLVPGTLLFLVGGIATLPFEAPQSHRALPAVVPAALLAALPLSAVARRGAVWAMPVAVWMAVAGASDAGLYFDAQTHDGAVLRENNLAETNVADALKSLGPGWSVLGPDGLVQHPTVRYLAGERKQLATGMDAVTALPFDGTAPVAVVGLLEEPATLTRARALYPTSRFETFGAPGLARPLVGVLAVDLETQRQSLGWLAEGADGAESRVAPDGVAASPAVAWRSLLKVPQTGTYAIQAGDADVWIDGTQVMTSADRQAARVLAAGTHDLRVQRRSPATTPGVRVEGATTFALPAPGGLLFTRMPDGAAPNTRVDVAPYEIFDGIWGQHWSARWEGRLYTEDGAYQFQLHGRSKATLRIDGAQVVQTENDAVQVGSARLAAGWHEISIEYRDDEPYARLFLAWKSPTASEFTPIPDSALRPALPQ